MGFPARDNFIARRMRGVRLAGMKQNLATTFWVTIACFVLTLPGLAAVKLPAVFSDHMVLQRDLPAPIWGTAEPGEKVTITFRDQTKTSIAGADGRWSAKLDPLKAGGPDSLTVNEITVADVLVGDVWVGSGQSNMEQPVGGYVKNDAVLAGFATNSYPQIRLSRSGGAWRAADPEGNKHFSALLFAFGVKVNKELDVPVGLMVGAVSGTPSGYWLTEEMLKADGPAQAAIAKASDAVKFEELTKKYQAELLAYEAALKQAQETKQKPPRKPAPPRKAGDCRGVIGNLYARHIQPMVGYGIRGVVWDQGESGTAIEALDQYHTMGALIRGWREAWGQGEFPFIYIQKPSGGGCAWDTTNAVTSKAESFMSLPVSVPADGLGIETHVRIMEYPNTAMAISSDLGAALHPSNKSGYGSRAADVALGFVYGRKVEYYGPLYASHAVDAGKVRIKFTHVGQGLAFRNGDKLQGFAVAGEDRIFRWADAVIEGDTVEVASATVTKPVAVRYAWASNRRWANLFNKDGLPAISFRTDSW